MNKLFDIAHAEWERRTIIEEDRQFLLDQRGPRQMSMTTEDKTYTKAVGKYRKRKEKQEKRLQRYQENLNSSSLTVAFSSDDSVDEPSAPYNDGCSSGINTSKRPLSGTEHNPLPKRCIIDDPHFNAALDRTRTSTRQAMMIVTPALSAAGIDVSQLALSRTSLMGARNVARETLAEAVRNDFQPTVPLVAHFDGKLLDHFDGVKRDCFPIVVSGLGVEKLLGIPMLPVGTGLIMGQKVVEFVREWPGVEEHLAGLCFDTTASNTGIHKGAITIVQQSLNRRLLFLTCRHHMLEICATAVFGTFFTSKGPEIELFGRFKSQWSLIDKSIFDAIDTDSAGEGCLTSSEKSWLDSRRAIVIENMHRHLKTAQPREDYREFAHLTLLILGEESVDLNTKFCSPGAYHRARWMAKGIYCLKIFLFRRQFVLSKREMNALRRICLFTCPIYSSLWFAAPMPTSAPINDLKMLQLIDEFSNVDSQIASTADKKLRLHLWYLSEDLAALPLFGDDISNQEKQTIVAALQKDPREQDLRRLEPNQITTFKNLSIEDFVTKRSLNLFTALQLSQEFLTVPVCTWNERSDYIESCKIVHAMKVVNDCTERAVRLATDFNVTAVLSCIR